MTSKKSQPMVPFLLPESIIITDKYAKSKEFRKKFDKLQKLFKTNEFEYVLQHFEFTDSYLQEFLTCISLVYEPQDFLILHRKIKEILAGCDYDNDESIDEALAHIKLVIKHSGLPEIVSACDKCEYSYEEDENSYEDEDSE